MNAYLPQPWVLRSYSLRIMQVWCRKVALIQDGGLWLNTSERFVKYLNGAKFRKLVHSLLHSICSHPSPTCFISNYCSFHRNSSFRVLLPNLLAIPWLVAVISEVGRIPLHLTNSSCHSSTVVHYWDCLSIRAMSRSVAMHNTLPGKRWVLKVALLLRSVSFLS